MLMQEQRNFEGIIPQNRQIVSILTSYHEDEEKNMKGEKFPCFTITMESCTCIHEFVCSSPTNYISGGNLLVICMHKK